MSQKDRDRLKVLHEVEQGHLRQKQGGEQLKVSERWVRPVEFYTDKDSLFTVNRPLRPGPGVASLDYLLLAEAWFE